MRAIIKYQDRIVCGVDRVWRPYLRKQPPTDVLRQGYVKQQEAQYQVDWDCYAGQGEITCSGRKVQALNLPREVLERFYHGNAERLYKLRDAWEKKP